MRPDTIADIDRRIAASSTERSQTRDLVRAGRGELAEDDPTRSAAFDARTAKSLGSPEAVHDTNDFQPAAFLADGAIVRRAVARVLVQAPNESTSASGFLISPDLFITNQHVLHNVSDCRNAVLIFDDEVDHTGKKVPRTLYRLAPDQVALFSDEKVLDYAVVSIGERIEGAATIEELGYCPLGFAPDRHRLGMNVNIIQHPNGMPKTIAIRNNLLTAREDSRLYYETDTEVGTSGSPVHNDQWDVVALHHYGDSAPPGTSASDRSAKTLVNEGIRISAIYDDLKARAATLGPVGQEIVNRALLLWADTSSGGRKLERRPPSPTELGESARTSYLADSGDTSMATSTQAADTLVIPLEISVRVGRAQTVVPIVANRQAPVQMQTAPARKRLGRMAVVAGGAEGVKLDTNYSNRNGFKSTFVPGVTLDLKAIAKPRKSMIAALESGETAAASGVLHYQNFSVVMHKKRRFALFTATNIDGPTYVSINRKTGLPAEEPEGETWYRDKRLDDAYIVNQDFYSEWSHLFDRGHLTRRDDPTWGANAVRANKDTFHFTNCTPQHWKFNESIKFWQGIERYVLEKGLVATGKNKKLSVLQGPIFDDNDEWGDDVQIPSAFWKVIVWKGQGGLKAVAMIADQTALFAIERAGGAAPPPSDTPVFVNEYRSTIATIEQKTGLDLSAIRAYDTSAGDLPTVGERVALITKWSDIRLK